MTWLRDTIELSQTEFLDLNPYYQRASVWSGK
jgi:hypothetical protein